MVAFVCFQAIKSSIGSQALPEYGVTPEYTGLAPRQVVAPWMAQASYYLDAQLSGMIGKPENKAVR
jgi:hypothetical protein